MHEPHMKRILGLIIFGGKISEAYQVLSNEDLRKQYDKYGKERAVPDSGFGKSFWRTMISKDSTDTALKRIPRSFLE